MNYYLLSYVALATVIMYYVLDVELKAKPGLEKLWTLLLALVLGWLLFPLALLRKLARLLVDRRG